MSTKDTKPKKRVAAKKSSARSAARNKPVTSKKGVKATTTKRKPALKKTGSKEKPATSSKSPSRPKRKVTKSSTSAKANKKKTPDTVQLPKRMSMRSQEKSLVLSELFQREFYDSAVLISRIAGICFILVGGLFSMMHVYSPDLMCGSACVAQAVGSDTTAIPAMVVSPEPRVTLLSTMPTKVTNDFTVPLEITNTTDISASLEFTSRTDGTRIAILPVSDLGNDKYAIEITKAALEFTEYTLKVEVRGLLTERYQTFTLGSFTVSDTEVDTTAKPGDELENTTTAETELLEINAVDPQSNNSAAEASAQPIPLISDQAIRNEERERNAPITYEITAPQPAADVVSVSVSFPKAAINTEFYVRPTSGVNSQRIGELPNGGATIRVDTARIPNGDYELFARATLNGQTIATEPSFFTVANAARSSTGRTADQVRELLVISRELNDELYQDFAVDDPVAATVDSIVEQQLRDDVAILDELFTAYASAKQTSDPALLAAAEQAIENYRKGVVASALDNEDYRFLADEISAQLEQRLSEYAQRVSRFEDIRRERTERDSSLDTDEDGISDVDEQVIYQTDPTSADSDGDGFSDGAEIVGGFDPLSAESEAVIDYESPRDPIRSVVTDKLLVADVSPNIVLPSASTTEQVQAVIKGTALPNSFVTLFIFSTPTIVTVRTDASGAFEYTFTKELEDGQHQVFAALTDNTGQIIAQSEPFTFIKEARAFSPVDAETLGSEATVVAVESSSMGSFQIAVGMAVLAMGILLILLGVGLRQNRPEEHIVAGA